MGKKFKTKKQKAPKQKKAKNSQYKGATNKLGMKKGKTRYAIVGGEKVVLMDMTFKKLDNFKFATLMNPATDKIRITGDLVWTENTPNEPTYKELTQAINDLGFKFVNLEKKNDETNTVEHGLETDLLAFDGAKLEKVAVLWHEYNLAHQENNDEDETDVSSEIEK